MKKTIKNILNQIKHIRLNKKIIILLSVLLVLFLFILIFQNPAKKYTKPEIKSVSKIVKEFDATKLKKISLFKAPMDELLVELTKNDENWVVSNADNYPADTEAITLITDFAQEVKNSDVISTKTERQAEFGVSKETGTRIKLEGEGFTLEFFAGSMGAINGSQYFREVNSQDVLLVKSNLMFITSRQLDGFKDKSLITLNSEDVKKIQLQAVKDIIIFEKEGEEWVYSKNNSPMNIENYTVVDEAFKNLMAKVTTLKTNSFPKDEVIPQELKDKPIEEQPYQIMVTTTDDTQHAVGGVITKENKFYIKSNTLTGYFELPVTLKEDIFEKEYTKKNETPTE